MAAAQMTFDELPKSQFGAILADPPWDFKTWSGKTNARGPQNHYDTMEMNDIAKLPVGDLAADNCVLFMWTCWPVLFAAPRIMTEWGFTYKTCAFSWMKADPYRLFADDATPFAGLGYWTRANTEPCLLATRGKPKRLNADVRQGIIAPRREHSRKPDGIHERIERLVAGPYLELFARQQRPGWTVWGNQTDKFKPSAAQEQTMTL
jgi:N6-adenosine-specific RNA methylase IME4